MKQILKHFTTSCIGMLWVMCLAAQPALVRVEYYIDTDPGYNNGTAISFTAGSTNLTNIALNINPTSVTKGVHVLGIRAKDINGAWSQDNRWLFARPYAADTTTPGPIPALSRIEYYIDTDPGYNNATSIGFTTGSTNLGDVALSIDPASLTEGVHVLGIRTKDINGAWSQDNRWLFARPYASDTTVPGPVPNLKLIEYYIDTDPGYGNGVKLATENATNLANFNLSVNISSLVAGGHTLYIRSKDGNNTWSLDNKFDFTVSSAIASPSIVVNSISKKIMCAGDAFSIGYEVKGTFNTGNVFTAQLSASGGSFATPTTIGTITSKVSSVIACVLPTTLTTGTGYKVRVISSSPAVTGIASTDAITINAIPAVPTISAGGLTTFCQGGSVTLTSSVATSYLWSTGATTQSIIVSSAGNYSVTVKNASGCSNTSAAKTVTVNPLPTPGISASGATTFCQGGSVTLDAGAGYNSYLWSTGATTQSINVSGAGNYTVTVTNGNGCMGTSPATVVTVNPLPATPTISAGGSTTLVCPGKTVTLTSSAGNSYLWNTGATTQSIVVTAAGSYSVKVTNASGCQSASSAATAVTYNVCAKPTGLITSNITGTAAKLSWAAVTCAVGYQYEWRVKGTIPYTVGQTTVITKTLTGLLPATTYQWRVVTACKINPDTITSAGYTNGPEFTTLAAAFAANDGSGQQDFKAGTNLSAMVYPNPASKIATINITNAKGFVQLILTDLSGKQLWQSAKTTDRNIAIDVSRFAAGTYMVIIKGEKESVTLKMVKE